MGIPNGSENKNIINESRIKESILLLISKDERMTKPFILLSFLELSLMCLSNIESKIRAQRREALAGFEVVGR